jgi:chromosome partitioning protein
MRMAACAEFRLSAISEFHHFSISRTQNPGMLIELRSRKGGVGKSTTAIHLAAWLQQRAPAVLVDGDANRTCVKWARRGRLAFPVVDLDDLARVRGYSHAVYDTPGGLDPDADELAGHVDLVIVPMSCTIPDLDAAIDTCKILKRAGARFRILLTRVPPRPSRAGEEMSEAVRSAGIPVFAGWIRRSTAFERAAEEGVTVAELADVRSRAYWQDIEAIGEELL